MVDIGWGKVMIRKKSIGSRGGRGKPGQGRGRRLSQREIDGTTQIIGSLRQLQGLPCKLSLGLAGKIAAEKFGGFVGRLAEPFSGRADYEETRGAIHAVVAECVSKFGENPTEGGMERYVLAVLLSNFSMKGEPSIVRSLLRRCREIEKQLGR